MARKPTNGSRVYANWYARLSPGWNSEDILYNDGDEECQPPPEALEVVDKE